MPLVIYGLGVDTRTHARMHTRAHARTRTHARTHTQTNNNTRAHIDVCMKVISRNQVHVGLQLVCAWF